MAKHKYSPEKIIRKLREAEILLSKGLTAQRAARKIGVCEQTYYRWRKEYGGMRAWSNASASTIPISRFLVPLREKNANPNAIRCTARRYSGYATMAASCASRRIIEQIPKAKMITYL